jgi:predicted kinase
VYTLTGQNYPPRILQRRWPVLQHSAPAGNVPAEDTATYMKPVSLNGYQPEYEYIANDETHVKQSSLLADESRTVISCAGSQHGYTGSSIGNQRHAQPMESTVSYAKRERAPGLPPRASKAGQIPSDTRNDDHLYTTVSSSFSNTNLESSSGRSEPQAPVRRGRRAQISSDADDEEPRNLNGQHRHNDVPQTPSPDNVPVPDANLNGLRSRNEPQAPVRRGWRAQISSDADDEEPRNLNGQHRHNDVPQTPSPDNVPVPDANLNGLRSRSEPQAPVRRGRRAQISSDADDEEPRNLNGQHRHNDVPQTPSPDNVPVPDANLNGLRSRSEPQAPVRRGRRAQISSDADDEEPRNLNGQHPHNDVPQTPSPDNVPDSNTNLNGPRGQIDARVPVMGTEVGQNAPSIDLREEKPQSPPIAYEYVENSPSSPKSEIKYELSSNGKFPKLVNFF